MATNKKGFILYADQKELFDQLPNDKAGELIKHIFSYVNDENPITEDLLLKLAFTPIKQQLKRDLKKFEEVKDKKSISGREGNLKRWNIDLYNRYKDGDITLEIAENIAEGRKVSHTDKVPSQKVANIADNDNDNVKDNVKDINISFSVFWDLYGKKKGSKDACEKKWLKLKDAERVKIIETLPNFKASIKDIQYLPFPETYLNKKSWNDELEAPKEFNKNFATAKVNFN